MSAATTFILKIGVLLFLLTCWALADVTQRDFGTTEKKAVWIFVASLPFIGFVIYLIFGVRKGKRYGSAKETLK